MATLEQFYKQLAERNAGRSFYRPAAQAIMATPWASERSSTGANLGASIAQGLLGGFLANRAREQQATYESDLADVLRGSLAGKSVFRPSLDKADMASISAFKLQRDLAEEDALNKLDQEFKYESKKQNLLAEKETEKEFFKGMLEADNPRKQRQIVKVGKALGFLPDDFEEPAPSEGILPQADYLNPGKIEESGPKLGLKTLRQLEDERINQLVAPDPYDIELRKSAMTSARQEANDRRERSLKLFEKPLKEKEQELSEISDVTELLKQGIRDAGATGSAIGSRYEKGLAFIDSMIPGEQFPEATRQVEGDTALRKAAVSETLREGQKLKGAFSDSDRAFLMSQAPGEDKPKAVNEAILKRLEAAKSRMEEQNSFYNYVLSETDGNFDKASTYWNLYKQANPLFDEKGNLRENRTPWQNFDFTGNYEKFLKGEKPEIDLKQVVKEPQAQAIPSVGSMYNGEEVVSVRRVR